MKSNGRNLCSRMNPGEGEAHSIPGTIRSNLELQPLIIKTKWKTVSNGHSVDSSAGNLTGRWLLTMKTSPDISKRKFLCLAVTLFLEVLLWDWWWAAHEFLSYKTGAAVLSGLYRRGWGGDRQEWSISCTDPMVTPLDSPFLCSCP